MMDEEQWLAIDALFDAALDLPPRERARWLEEVCPGDSCLKEQVERLLAHSEVRDDLLQTNGASSPRMGRDLVLALAKRLGLPARAERSGAEDRTDREGPR